MTQLRVLIVCERSQVEQQAFERLGHFACSLDIAPCYGPRPERHIVADAYSFPLEGWDLIVAHPPCTYLTRAANVFRNEPGRVNKVVPAIRLWYRLLHESPCPVAVENPVGILNAICEPSQIINPWQFGDPYAKETCLWLSGLPRLVPSVSVRPEGVQNWTAGKKAGCAERVCRAMGLKLSRSDARSKSFPGIAAAMAVQWPAFLESNFSF